MSKRLKKNGIAVVVLIVVAFLFLRFGNLRIDKTSPPVRGISQPAFEVITYNAHLLPPMANSIVGKRSDNDERCAKIAAQLSQFDISGLVEVFDEKLAAKMIEGMNANPSRQFSFVRSPTPKGAFQFTSGGLLLFSRFPILEENSLVFSRGSRFLTSGFQAADGLAAKGALHARLSIDTDQELDCFLVHLESYSRSIRKSQIEELAAFLREHCRSGVPYLAMGDFNIAGPLGLNSFGSSEYRNMVDQLSMSGFKLVDIAIDKSETKIVQGTSDALADHGGNRIDYIFLGLPDSDSIDWPTTSKTMQFLDNEVAEGSLSDHAAVWANIQIDSLSGDD